MPVQPGQNLDQYRLTEKIGEGGMGQVWRAIDTGLDRFVAVKILPEAFAGDRDRLARFEREAKAVAALAHPNILAVYGFGRFESTSYMVTELLEGQTLRERLATGPLPPRKAADLARQIARGLAAAHDRGLAHRDLKPDNVFVTDKGRAKILDFGLAFSTGSGAGAAADATHTPTATGLTAAGAAVGTPEYMSPEQVRGKMVDHRTDVFSFGILLYEMLTGVRPFHRDTAAEAMTAVLREDPPDPAAEGGPPIPGALARVVERCLEKRPEERFQSASDLAFAVENAVGATSSADQAALPAEPAREPTRRKPLLVVAAIAVVAGLAFLAGRGFGSSEPPQPEYAQLTFRQGMLSAARFADDGGSVVYSASWDGEASRLYSVHEGSPESRSLDVEDVELLAVSSRGEMALLLRPRTLGGWMFSGTLARLPLGGGAPRELLEDVGSADWDPSGEQLAVTRPGVSFYALEYPPDNLLHKTNGWISHVRFSPDGKLIAFCGHGARADDAGMVAVTDLAGNVRGLTRGWSSIQGLAWAPSGKEILFTAGVKGTIKELRAVDLDGNERLLSSAPVDLRIHDVVGDGRVLVSRNTSARRIVGKAPRSDREIGLSWLDWSFPTDLTPDGLQMLFTEQGEGGGPSYSTYVRSTAGDPAILLGEGQSRTFSPDGRQVVSTSVGGGADRHLNIYPVGAGQSRRIELPGFSGLLRVYWIEPQRMLIVGSRNQTPYRVYLLDLESGETRPVSPENVGTREIAVDGGTGRFTARVGDGPLQVFSIHGGDPITLAGIEPSWNAYGFGEGGESIFIAGTREVPLPVQRVWLADGRRETVAELRPAEPAGLINIGPIRVTPDGRGYIYSYRQVLSTLYVMDGLR